MRAARQAQKASTAHDAKVPPQRGESAGGAGFSARSAKLGKKSTEFPRVGGDASALEAKREAEAQKRRSRRYTIRRVLWKVTTTRACKLCGRALMDRETGLIIVQTAEGYSITLGQFKCARVWLCAVCSANIRQARAEETVKALVEWIGRGGTALLVTLTERHAAAHRLADLLDALQGTRKGAPVDVEAARAGLVEAKMAAKSALDEVEERKRRAVQIARLSAPKGSKNDAMAAARELADKRIKLVKGETDALIEQAREKVAATDRQAGAYQRLITGGAWAGRPERGEEGIRDRIGYLGMMRSTEITLSVLMGWHPHLHLIVLLGARTTGEGVDREITGVFEPSQAALDEFEEHVRKVWAGTLRRISPEIEPSLVCYEPGCKCGGRGHAVDIQRIYTVQDAKAKGEYVVKTQDGKNPAYELTRGDIKNAYAERMTPFQLLERIGEFLGGVVLDDGGPDLDWCMDHWVEYEPTVTGRRAMEWTRHLRRMLGLDGGDSELDDADLQFEGETLSEFRAGVQVQADAWPYVTGSGLDLAALVAVEGTGGIDMAKVRAVIVEQAGAPDRAPAHPGRGCRGVGRGDGEAGQAARGSRGTPRGRGGGGIAHGEGAAGGRSAPRRAQAAGKFE